MESQKLLEYISRYYPQGYRAHAESNRHAVSDHSKELESVVSSFHGSSNIWSERIKHLNSHCSLNFQPIMPNQSDKCLTYQMPIPGPVNKNRRLNLDISALAPTYALFIVERNSSDTEEAQKGDESHDLLDRLRNIVSHTHYSILHEFAKFNLETANRSIAEYLDETFQYEALPIELYNEPISGQFFDENGKKLTFYRALFQLNHIIQ